MLSTYEETSMIIVRVLISRIEILSINTNVFVFIFYWTSSKIFFDDVIIN